MVSVANAAGVMGGSGASGFASFIPLILIFVVFYFLLIRPQQKQAKQQQIFLNELKKGQKVVTKGGIYGEIIDIKDNILSLEIARETIIKVSRDAIAGAVDKNGAPLVAKKEEKPAKKAKK
ncbi:MAG: preprotein translocase subunit YajC [Desulfotalea sp.]